MVFNSLYGDTDPNATYALSDSNGEYALSLPPGTYYGIISEPSPDYALSPMAPSGAVDGNDFDPDTKRSEPVTLTSGDSGMGNFDAGFYQPVTIDSYVWEDANANGIQDNGEGGFTGESMEINLYDSEGEVVRETTTNSADGSFKIENVVPGTYEIEFVRPDGVYFTFQDEGSDDSKDSDVNPATGRVTVTLVSGEDDGHCRWRVLVAKHWTQPCVSRR